MISEVRASNESRKLRLTNFQNAEQGYELSFRGPKDDSPLLVEHDVPKFAHVVILASETKSTAKVRSALCMPI